MLKNLIIPFVTALTAIAVNASELVIAENGKCDYQIVIPDKSESNVVERWLLMTAKLMETAFEKNGFAIDVVKESEKTEGKPGIYLGATKFAKKNGVKVDQHDDWTYYIKAVGDDLIIVGNDKKDPFKTIRKQETPLALLGTVKGVCDFLREHAGVRFLFMNLDQSLYAPRGDGLGEFKDDGTLDIDTRSVAFTPVKKIAVPKDIDLKKTPMLKANSHHLYETFYYIANNFFPLTSFAQGSTVYWWKAIPVEQYAKSNPEYFGLTRDGKRTCDLPIPARLAILPYCPTNPGVQDLMFKEAEKLIKNGEKTIAIVAMDGFALCKCNCEECNKLFGMKAENLDQIRARGKSGKLWQPLFKITERVREKYPDVKIVMSNYQDTPISADIMKTFPDNVIPRIQVASQKDFDGKKGVEFPAGVCVFEENFTGFGRGGPYLPERTSEHAAEFVKTLARNKAKWVLQDGTIGYVRGLQGPAYYVYGRMMDDPSADWQAIHDEFCEAAFGKVAPAMKEFYKILDEHIALYSDYLGVMMPAWYSVCRRSRARDSKWHVTSIYTPEYFAKTERLLSSAEKNAKDPDVKARLRLVRVEFDYVRKLAKIFHLENAYAMNPNQANMDELLDAIDEWHAYLANLAEKGSESRSRFKPLDGWPEMRPFCGHHYAHAALKGNGYQQTWRDTCLNWDTQAIREGSLDEQCELKVPEVEANPGIDSKTWNAVPGVTLRRRHDMPFSNMKTTMKVLRDQKALYILVKSLNPSKHPEDVPKQEPDANIFRHEHVEIGISPPGSNGKVYRIAVNPVAGSRFDSIITPGDKKRTQEDKSWNGSWEFAVETTLEKRRYVLAGRIWTAWFRIPFSDFGLKAPEAGEKWGFNLGRNRIPQYMIWKDGKNATEANSLGTLVF